MINYFKSAPVFTPFDCSHLNENGFFILREFIDANLLDNLHDTWLNAFNTFSFDYTMPGYLMGNLAINKCIYHYHVYLLLEKCGIINFLCSNYPEFRYVSFGGNLNIQNSRKQRIHRDNFIPTLVINIPFANTSSQTGSLSISPQHYLRVPNTYNYFKRHDYSREISLQTVKGDVILRFSNVWHRGNANKSHSPDFMLSFSLRTDFIPNSIPIGLVDGNAHKFSPEISFGANIYPSTFAGKLLEFLDVYCSTLSFPLLHFANLIRGR